jgi:polyphosphate kinase
MTARVAVTPIVSGLCVNGLEWVRIPELTRPEREYVDALFADSIYPVLTPLAIDLGHPFPHIQYASLNIILLVERGDANEPEEMFGVIQVPSFLDRVVILPGRMDRSRFVLLEDVIAAQLGTLFGGARVVAHTVFRIIRNADEPLLGPRLRGDAVRLEIVAGADERFEQMLQEALDLESPDVYRVAGPVDPSVFMAVSGPDGFGPRSGGQHSKPVRRLARRTPRIAADVRTGKLSEGMTNAGTKDQRKDPAGGCDAGYAGALGVA